MTAILGVGDLQGGFGANQVLHGVDIGLQEGRVAVLLGLNGAGKSVTLKTIAGLYREWGGSVKLDGRELAGLDTEDRVRAGLSLVPQTRGIFPELTVEQNLRLGGAMLKSKTRLAGKLGEVLEVFPLLASRRRQLAGSMSGGEQATLAVARAHMGEPTVLMLDEPSAGLSPIAVDGLGEVLQRVRALGTTMLLVEQNVGFALTVADEALIMEKGRVVYQAPAADLDGERVAQLLGIGALVGDGLERSGASRRGGGGRRATKGPSAKKRAPTTRKASPKSGAKPKPKAKASPKSGAKPKPKAKSKASPRGGTARKAPATPKTATPARKPRKKA